MKGAENVNGEKKGKREGEWNRGKSKTFGKGETE